MKIKKTKYYTICIPSEGPNQWLCLLHKAQDKSNFLGGWHDRLIFHDRDHAQTIFCLYGKAVKLSDDAVIYEYHTDPNDIFILPFLKEGEDSDKVIKSQYNITASGKGVAAIVEPYDPVALQDFYLEGGAWGIYVEGDKEEDKTFLGVPGEFDEDNKPKKLKAITSYGEAERAAIGFFTNRMGSRADKETKQ